MTKLEWAAKKAAYFEFRVNPQEGDTPEERENLEAHFVQVYKHIGVPTESHNAQIIYGGWP